MPHRVYTFYGKQKSCTISDNCKEQPQLQIDRKWTDMNNCNQNTIG